MRSQNQYPAEIKIVWLRELCWFAVEMRKVVDGKDQLKGAWVKMKRFQANNRVETGWGTTEKVDGREENK